MTEFIIKVTAKHRSVAEKYLKMAAEGEISTLVDMHQLPNGKLEATIDDEPIGFMKIDAEEIPEVCDIKIKGLSPDDPNSFVAEIITGGGKKTGKKSDNSLIDDEKERIISNNIVTEEDLEGRIHMMKEGEVDSETILATLELFQPYARPIMGPCTPYRDLHTEDFTFLQIALQNVVLGFATMLQGPKSVGKDTLIDNVAYCAGMPVLRIGCQQDMLLEDIYGGVITDNSAADNLRSEGAVAWVKLCAGEKLTDEEMKLASDYCLYRDISASIRLHHEKSGIQEIAENGGLVVFNEVNMAKANILQYVINPMADDTKVLQTPNNGNIKLNNHCAIMGSMNPGYAGTCELNDATLSRCTVLDFTYPKSIKSQLKANFAADTPLKEKHFAICDEYYKDIVTAIENNSISDQCLNVRGFVRALRRVERFPASSSLASAIKLEIISACKSADDKAVLIPMLYDKVSF